jgi:IMP dehydrogenase
MPSILKRLHPSLQTTEFTLDSIIAAPQQLVNVQINQIDLTTHLTRRTTLQLPIISSPMDTVTGHKMAILMARLGGIGVIHQNYPTIEDQMKEVEKVRRYEAGFVKNPIVISLNATLADVRTLELQYGFSSFPVTKDGTLNTPLVGLITNKDTQLYDHPEDGKRLVRELMTPREKLIVGQASVTTKKDNIRAANKIIRERKLDTLPIVDKNDLVVALVTRSDMLKNQHDTLATKDANKQLKVYVAVDSLPQKAFLRVEAAVAAGASGIVIDSRGMYLSHLETAKFAKKLNPELDVIVGNVVDGAAVKEAMEQGGRYIDAFRMGMGTGDICITSEQLGLGRAAGSATRDVVAALAPFRRRYGHVGVIVDGGIKIPWHIIASLGLGADAVMMGTELAGLDESPSVEQWDPEMQRQAKTVRGMGSQEVIMERFGGGGVSRYDLYDIVPEERFVEGISKKVPFKGSGERFVKRLFAGVKSGFQGLNSQNVEQLRQKIYFLPRVVATTKGLG